MKSLLLVGLGGGLGAIARYQLSGLVLHQTNGWKFPAATFVVNVLGCLIAGVLAGLIEKQGWFTPETRLFLFTGLLGGFTTFSAFGMETVNLLRRGETGIAVLYAAASVCCGLAVLWLSMKGVARIL